MSDSYKIYASKDYVDSKGLPDGANVNMQLVTDTKGEKKWEEKIAYINGIKISWNGDTTGLENVKNVYFLISDKTPKVEELIDGTLIIYNKANNEYQNMTITENLIIVENEDLYLTEGFIVANKDDLTFGELYIPKKGTYVMNYGNVYVAEIISSDYAIKTISEPYLPTTVPVIQTATVGQTIAVKTVDENGKPTEWEASNLPEGFSGDYNDLTNKPTIPSIEGLASETYVNNKITSLIDTAPDTLNTLNELASALGDDPNFATTIMTELGNKALKTDLDLLVKKAGDTMTGELIISNSSVARLKTTCGSYSIGLFAQGTETGLYDYGKNKYVVWGQDGTYTFIGNAVNVTGTVAVANGGTGKTSLDSGKVLIGNGTNAVSLRSITNLTDKGNLGWTASIGTNLVTLNTLAYWDGSFNSATSNLSKLGTIISGVWNATAIGIPYGGTGATNASTARTNLGIIPGNILIRSSTSTNINNWLNYGSYGFGTGDTNRPNNESYGMIWNFVSNSDVHNNTDNWIWQLGLTTTSDSIYLRKKVNSDSWTAWKSLALADNVIKKSGDTMSGDLTVSNSSVARIKTTSGSSSIGLFAQGSETGLYDYGKEKNIILGQNGTYSFNGNAVNVTGTVAIANGGTGATTAANARANLGITMGQTSLISFAANHTADSKDVTINFGKTYSSAPKVFLSPYYNNHTNSTDVHKIWYEVISVNTTSCVARVLYPTSATSALNLYLNWVAIG